MTHFTKVLHKANSSTGGNTGEEAGRQAIRRRTDSLRRFGLGQRSGAAPSVGGSQALVCSRHWARSQQGAQTCAGRTSRRTGSWARSKPPSSVQRCASTHTYTYTCAHTQCTNTCTCARTHNIHTCTHARVCAHTCMYTQRTRVHTCTQCTHTHIHTPAGAFPPKPGNAVGTSWDRCCVCASQCSLGLNDIYDIKIRCRPATGMVCVSQKPLWSLPWKFRFYTVSQEHRVCTTRNTQRLRISL